MPQMTISIVKAMKRSTKFITLWNCKRKKYGIFRSHREEAFSQEVFRQAGGKERVFANFEASAK